MEILSDNLQKFAENNKKKKKVKEDFHQALTTDIILLESSLKRLISENDDNFIFNELKNVNLDDLPFPLIGRIQTILNYLPQNILHLYRTTVITKDLLKEYPTKPEKPDTNVKEKIKEYNETVKKYNIDVKKISDWNIKINTLMEYLDSVITVDLYGDLTFDISDKPYVYFKFLNTGIDEIEIFMLDLKNCPAPPIKKIKAIHIEDISGLLPSFLKSANEVRVYFETLTEAEEFHNSKDYVEAVYEKYLIKNDTMASDGGEWGMFNKRKTNLATPVMAPFSMNTLPTPVNLNSGEDEQEKESFYDDDYEANLSDCYYAKNDLIDRIYSIVPKDFFDKYGSVLVNPDMFIVGISDNKKWRKYEDIYFRYLGDETEADEELENTSEYSEELYEYMNDNLGIKTGSLKDCLHDIGVLNDRTDISFKEALKKVLDVENFDDDWEEEADFYSLQELDNYPTFEMLFNKLSNKDKQKIYTDSGVSTERELREEVEFEEHQDFENFEITEFTDNILTVFCGGDWQIPAKITFGMNNGKLAVKDYHLDMN
jgi:hypothetical protein